MKKKKPTTLPRGYRTCTASLAVSDVDAAVNYYEQVFGAEVRAIDDADAAKFAAIKIGNSMLFVSAGWAPTGHLPTNAGQFTPVVQHMYVEDCDATAEAAISAGATLLAEATETYWGERCATILDPFGHAWTIATRLETLNATEIEARRTALLGQSEVDDPAREIGVPAAGAEVAIH